MLKYYLNQEKHLENQKMSSTGSRVQAQKKKKKCMSYFEGFQVIIELFALRKIWVVGLRVKYWFDNFGQLPFAYTFGKSDSLQKDCCVGPGRG